MNIYCKCGKELEIAEDLGSEIHVFTHDCIPPIVDAEAQEQTEGQYIDQSGQLWIPQ